MSRDWIKPGVLAAVKVVDMDANGWVACGAIEGTPKGLREVVLHHQILSPAPTGLTPEQAEVIAAARAFRRAFVPASGYSEPATIFMRAVDRLLAAEAAPDPVATLRDAARKAEFTLRQSGAIVTADMLADAISSSEVCP